MGHGKESPRQKMIGMMYLVLTAMLALNVSKEAVEAFKTVDEGLVKTTMNYQTKNELTYEEFQMKYSSNPEKVGPWKNLADDVRVRSNELFDYLQDLKIEIVQEAEGEDTEAIQGRIVDSRHIEKIDENNIPSQILIGSEYDGKAYDLKAAIIDHREFLLDLIGNKDINAAESISKGLNTEDPPTLPGSDSETWETHNFQALPLVAVITILSKLQVDVRNAEAEALNFLYSQIDAGSFKFNRLVPTVITPSNYIVRGNEYQAEIFIAATDTTQKPEVLIGRYEEAVDARGESEYRMVGDPRTLPIDESGRGIYKVRTSSVGPKTYGGLIRMKSPDGGTVSFPFEASYTVSEPNVAVEATGMNIFYVGIDNPVNISVPGVGSDKLTVRMTNGSIKKGTVEGYRGQWIVSPTAAGRTSDLTVSANINGEVTTFPPITFRCKNVPDPVAVLDGKSEGTIAKARLMAQQALQAEMRDFEFDIKYTVTSFKVSVTIRGYTTDAVSSSNRITPEQRDLFNNLSRNAMFQITEVKAVGPSGRQVNLNPIVLKVQ